MSQRVSGYKRLALDQYETPTWVTEALIPHLPVIGGAIWEPACGRGKMVDALGDAGFDVLGTDIAYGLHGFDFLQDASERCAGAAAAIVTNPPYALAREFIERALSLEGVRVTAMLLRCDFDSAASREPLFGGCSMFAKKIVLTRRIRWIEESTGSPSFNHAWFVWDRQHQGAPTLAYGR